MSKQKLTVFYKGPRFVVYEHFQFVAVVTQFVEIFGLYIFFVFARFFADVLYLVHAPAFIYYLVNQRFYHYKVSRNSLYQFDLRMCVFMYSSPNISLMPRTFSNRRFW